MNADTRRFSVLASRLMCLCVFASPWFICSGAFAADPPPVIDSITPNSLVEKPVPQPQIVITGQNLRQPGTFGAPGNPTVTITHTTLQDVSFSAVASTPFDGSSATLAANLNHFNMLQMPLGVYDLTLTRPDGQFATVPAGFSLITEPDPLPGVIEMRIASRWGGPVQGADISDDGTIAYIANGRMFRILDLSDETNPVEISSLFLGDGGVSDVKVKDGFAFIAMGGNQGGFRVVDVSDLAAPDLVWAINYGSAGANVELWGDYAYVGARETVGASIRVFDISDPLNAVSLGTISTGSVNAFTIHGDRLYSASGSSTTSAKLQVHDLAANAVQPPQLTEFQTGVISRPMAIAVNGDHAYISTWRAQPQPAGGLLAVDISDLSSPTLTSQLQDFYKPRGLAVLGDSLLLTDGSGPGGYPSRARGLVVLDIGSNPAIPSIVTEYKPRSLSNIYRVEVVGQRAHLSDGLEGLMIYDMSNPTQPVRLGDFHSPSSLVMMGMAGEDLVVGNEHGGFTILDVSDSTNPQVKGIYLADSFEDLSVMTLGLNVVDDVVFLSLRYIGLEAVDISDRSNPALISRFFPPPPNLNNGSYFGGLDVVDGVAHLGFWDSGWCSICGCNNFVPGGDSCRRYLTVDVSDPANMVELGRWGISGDIPLNILVNGIASYADGGLAHPDFFKCMDVSDVENPIQVPGSYAGGRQFALSNGALFVPDGHPNGDEQGLKIYDVISDPFEPLYLTTAGVGSKTYAVSVQNERAYLARQSPVGLTLLDVATPSNPVEIDHIDIGGGSDRQVLAVEPHVYVSNTGLTSGADGLQILNVVNLPPPPPPCHAADFDCNGVVNVFDLLVLLGAWGQCPPPERSDCPADLNGDGVVNVDDLLIIILNYWG